MKRTKRFLSAFLAIAMVFCYIPGMAFAETEVTTATEAQTAAFADMPNDWSTTALSNAAANGLLKGYEETDGLFIKPSGTLTRAEIVTIVNRAFGAKDTTALNGVADVSSTSWHATEIAKAVHMKTMSLATTMRPNDKITRQEALTILARAFKIETSDSNYSALNAFSDKDNIASWAKGSMCALVEKGVLSGSDGNVNPIANITRAEFAKIMDNMVKQYVNTTGTVSEVIASGSVMINVPGGTLSNVTINGDLIIGDGVGSGEVTLDSVKVTGKTIVRGGGVHSIIVKGNSSLTEVIVAKVDGEIRVAVEGSANVDVIVIDDGKDDIIVEGKVGTVEVVVDDVPVVVRNATVTIINVTAKNANLTIVKGATVTTLKVAQAAEGSKVDVAGSVTKLINEAPKTNLVVTGTVKTVEVTGSGSVGGIIGSSQDTNIINCSAEANIIMTDASNGAGVLGGGLEGGILSGCSATGTVTATATINYGGTTMGAIGVGGLAGCAFDSERVSDCTAEDVVISVGKNAIMVGGLLGYSGVVNEGPFTSDAEGFTLIKSCKTVNVTITADSGATRIGGIVGSGFCGSNYNSYYPASSAIHIVDCEARGTIMADNDVIVGSILGYAYRNCAVVSCDGTSLIGASNQIGAADAAQAVALVNVDSVQSQEDESIGLYKGPAVTAKVTTTGAVFAGGNGTVSDPWQIETKEQLALIQEHLDKHFVLTADIDLGGYNWVPIGAYVPNDVANGDVSANPDYAFTGSFSGSGCTIYNLTINRDNLSQRDMTGTGLFGGITGNVSIHNLNIKDTTIFSTGSCTGALVGMAMSSNESAIKNITVSGINKITGSFYVAGLVGSAQDTNIIDCTVAADVIMNSAGGSGAGILGGGLEGGILSGCTVTGTVTATEAINYGGATLGASGIGGLAGCAFDSEQVINCKAENIIIRVGANAIMIGGLLGYSGVVNEGILASNPEGFTLIKGCEVTNVNIQVGAGANRIGGIVGSGFCGNNYSSYYPASSAIHIVDCSASGSITADSDVIVGSILGYAFRNCAVVACNGDKMTGTRNQVGAADAAQVVLLENVK